ncbi:MAG: hypothetical protein N2491_04865 [Negativicutes bacterium]|nr:hypothetical protein [Negativicutes bacterium]
MNRITIFVGEFGSGKTELTVNYALQLARQGLKTAVVDIDLVKPYYRTRELSETLEANGVLVVAPEKRLAYADLPVLPSQLVRILEDPSYHVVIDVGGGESAIVLAQFRRQIAQMSPAVFMVVNTRRPFTSNETGIVNTLRKIEAVSGLRVTGLVSNTNLGPETAAEHVLAGYVTVDAAAKHLNLPVAWVVVPHWLDGNITLDCPVFILRPYTQYPWME